MALRPPIPAAAFGDPFDLDTLPLPRPAGGYAVQRLDHDRLLDRTSKTFLPVRDTALDALFSSFSEAHAAAGEWLHTHDASSETHALAIVPAAFDPILQRHILIYGVLRAQP